MDLAARWDTGWVVELASVLSLDFLQPSMNNAGTRNLERLDGLPAVVQPVLHISRFTISLISIGMIG